jgi:hypothetical protein
MSGRNVFELTPEEQSNVRGALQFLRHRVGGWEPLAIAIHVKDRTLAKIAGGRATVTPALAFKVARFTKVSMDDMLTGKFPAPGTCPYCGHVKAE